jgi:putative spermidine/putrescine transport system permease protein
MSSETQQILTTDGIPLEVSLKKAERKNKLKAFLLGCSFTFISNHHIYFSYRRHAY